MFKKIFVIGFCLFYCLSIINNDIGNSVYSVSSNKLRPIAGIKEYLMKELLAKEERLYDVKSNEFKILLIAWLSSKEFKDKEDFLKKLIIVRRDILVNTFGQAICKIFDLNDFNIIANHVFAFAIEGGDIFDKALANVLDLAKNSNTPNYAVYIQNIKKRLSNDPIDKINDFYPDTREFKLLFASYLFYIKKGDEEYIRKVLLLKGSLEKDKNSEYVNTVTGYSVWDLREGVHRYLATEPNLTKDLLYIIDNFIPRKKRKIYYTTMDNVLKRRFCLYKNSLFYKVPGIAFFMNKMSRFKIRRSKIIKRILSSA
ncbi:MAG: hypothetical protein ABIB11_05790 [Candidatus Omnitrophota bacterium]